MEPSAAEFVKASAASGNLAAGGTSFKAFICAHPASLALLAGVVIGVLGYRFLHHERSLEEEIAEAEAAKAAEASAS